MCIQVSRGIALSPGHSQFSPVFRVQINKATCIIHVGGSVHVIAMHIKPHAIQHCLILMSEKLIVVQGFWLWWCSLLDNEPGDPLFG